ncbi:uncharacterized protein LOC130897142 [Diorhabda carinulata]|uniref:uncharacterized protein LOC130897142 n=1 Tax=Diorhabda carinulata TaxID=1163345 RepID=UPI0025A2B723|nr:uncharacterized protein LOC130897142 [Diorhabda carinulata]
MALVAYDYDSASENEEEDWTNSADVIKRNSIKINTSEDSKLDKNDIDISDEEVEPNVGDLKSHSNIENDTKQKSLFSILPETKKIIPEVVEDKIEDFIPKPAPISTKKEKQKVKITIPSLSQFEDDTEEPEAKKIKSTVKSSGLLALLPPVKGSVKTNTSFIPKVVVNQTKPMSNTTSNTLVPNVIRKQVESKRNIKTKVVNEKNKVVLSDAESDDDLDVPETYDDEMWEKICGRPKNKPIIKEIEEAQTQEIIDIAPEPEKPYEGLDNQAFKHLVGKSRRPIGNIKLIDINEEEILPDKDIWMAKSLTDPELAPKPVIENPVDPTRRKKHHITYLAQQAKANEQELKNQWAISKNNKFASRAKYGF